MRAEVGVGRVRVIERARRREMETSKEVEVGGEQLVLPHRRQEHAEEPPLHRDGAGKPTSLTEEYTACIKIFASRGG